MAARFISRRAKPWGPAPDKLHAVKHVARLLGKVSQTLSLAQIVGAAWIMGLKNIEPEPASHPPDNEHVREGTSRWKARETWRRPRVRRPVGRGKQ